MAPAQRPGGKQCCCFFASAAEEAQGELFFQNGNNKNERGFIRFPHETQKVADTGFNSN